MRPEKDNTMSKQILVNVESQEKRIAFLENNVLKEFLIERGKETRLAGNVYKGRVENIVPGIQAAFVNVGLEKNGFLHVSDVISAASSAGEAAGEEIEEIQKPKETKQPQQSIAELLKPGQEIIVQVVKEPIGTKGVRLSTHISLPGRFLVLLPFDATRGISRRIQEREERLRLKEFLSKIHLPKTMGLIVRTVSEGTTRAQFAKDLRYLYNTWKKIEKRIGHASCPSLIHAELDLVLKTVRDSLTEEVDRVLIDSREEYRRVKGFIGSFFYRMGGKIQLYEGAEPLFERYGLEKEVEKMHRRKVWLKCGGYVVIDRTEALVAIDVNTGRNVGKDSLEETVLKTNLEAADEIARQMRLRNIGGIIIIDFIDMLSKHNQRAVLRRLKEALKEDKAKTNILPLSDIGLVEMTRQRIKETLDKEVYQECAYCDGRGLVKSPESMAIEISRHLSKLIRLKKEEELRLIVHPEIYKYLTEKAAQVVQEIERKYRVRVHLEQNRDLHLEDFKIYSSRSGSEILI